MITHHKLHTRNNQQRQTKPTDTQQLNHYIQATTRTLTTINSGLKRNVSTANGTQSCSNLAHTNQAGVVDLWPAGMIFKKGGAN